uniref:LAM_G_DOMAIN domain-containing protein n=1 Tax=Meloidogyne hapla TaxID=6305 RepID=A0A1I8BDZ5_MELHA
MDALAASNVYELIINSLQNATMFTASARHTVDTAFSLIDPKEDNSLFYLSNKSAIKSIELNNKVDETLKSLGVKEQSNRLWNVLDNLGNEVLTAQKNISWMRDVQQLLEDHHDRISTVFTSVDDAHEGLDSIKETIIEFNEDVEGIKKRVDSLQQFTSSSIKESIKNLTESAKEVDLLEKDFGLLEERTEEHSKQIKLLRKDLGVLKEKIDEAREKAAKIRIGVRSDPGSGCIREFLSPMRPTASNTISLKYRPVMDSPDSLLLFTQVQGTRTQNREYLAIELKQKKIHAAIIKRNIVYIPASARYTWYHIEVKRVANTVQVSVVQRLSVGGDSSRDIDEPTQVVVGKPDVNSDVIFNVIPGQTRLSLGLKDKSLAEELGFSTNKFLGTVGEMNVDGVNVPLWVFSKTEGMCEGATGPPVKTAIGHFFRNGFAQIRFPMAERSSSMLAVQFSAYSPNGLLYFRGSPTSGEFIGLELHEGAVALKADFGPEAKIALQLNGTNYADGRAHKVRVIRRDGEVHLQADPEADHISIALADSKALLDITESDHFVGGVPPDFPTAHFLQDHDLNFEGFFGCIHSVRPNQLSELDFDNPLRAQRKEAGCRYQEERLSTSERIIGFQVGLMIGLNLSYFLKGIDGGFLKTRGILLDSDATFSFNFRTKSLNALLLYQSADLQRLEQQRRAKRRRRTMKEEELEEIILRERRDVLTNPNDQSFLAFYLIDGRLTIHLGTDSDERIKRLVISSTQTYSDGLLHSVFLSRMGKEIQVRINDREVLATILDDERSIGGDRWTMLLGGVPSRLESLIQEAEVGTVESLVGCLSDFQLDYDRLPIILEEHYGTILGSCSLENGINEIIYENSENKNPAKDAPLINIEEEEDKYPLQQQQLFRKKSKQSLEQLAPTTVGGLLNNDNKNSEDTSEEEPIQSQCEGINKINFGDLKEYRFGLSESSHSKINFVEKPYPNYTKWVFNENRGNRVINFSLVIRAHMDIRMPFCRFAPTYFPPNYNGYKGTSFSISFEFRTEQRKGLLWVWASYRNYSRYFILHMDRGILKLVIKGHHQIKKLNYREKRFDDGKWHKLEIIKRGREISLKVDEFTTEKLLDAPSPKVMRRRMYIGGVISKHRRMFHLPRNRLPPSFNGCVRHFIVNGHEWDLNLNSKDVIHCAHTPGIGYIHNNGFAAFSPLDTQKTHLTTVTHKKSKEAKTIDLSIKFRLLPENLKENSKTKGRLLFAFLASGDDWQLKPRFVLWIDNNGMLGLSLHSSPHNIHIDTLFDSLNNSKNSFIVCPGQWHHFKLFLSTKGIKIELNEKIIKFGEQRLPLSLITQLRSLPVFVGGINASKALSLGIRSLFGCIQQFEIEGEQIIFEAKNANKWHKIIANGCPFN